MGLLSSVDEGHLESIVYFLSESLRAAIEAGDSLQQSSCDVPHLDHAMDCGQITDRLATFRQYIQGLWSQEVLLIAKILRARDLAKELRIHEPELRPEIDTFRLATVNSTDMQEMLLPDAQNLFNGAIQPKRFLETRGYSTLDDAEPALLGYRIAGQVDVRLLLDACSALHFGLAARYGFAAMPVRDAVDEDEPVLLEDEVEAPFLLTDFGEIVADVPLAPALDWRGIFPRQPLPH